MLREAAALELPAASLDSLIDRFGGPQHVAEMTGRKGRVVRVNQSRGGGGGSGGGGDGGRFCYQTRANSQNSGQDMDNLNVQEKRSFNDGKKNVAVISDAASTGISLHAALSARNQRRRMHITVELPWSADKAIQQLGRTHRSNQVINRSHQLDKACHA